MSTWTMCKIPDVAGGCDLTGPIVDLVRDAGFSIAALDVCYDPRTPKVVGPKSLGVARPEPAA